jgi:DNA-binding NarL/FixJ family response regulator
VKALVWVAEKSTGRPNLTHYRKEKYSIFSRRDFAVWSLAALLCYTSIGWVGVGGSVSKSILLADDSAVARRVIRNLVIQTLGESITYSEATGGVEALDKAITSQPDVVVLDIAMPEMNGVEVARHIGEHCPNSAVLAVSNYDVGPIIPRVKESGIRGFVAKSSMTSDLIPAIEALLEGKTYFTSRSDLST